MQKPTRLIYQCLMMLMLTLALSYGQPVRRACAAEPAWKNVVSPNKEGGLAFFSGEENR